jgi:probable blue pigment (indigoidine) exporter
MPLLQHTVDVVAHAGLLASGLTHDIRRVNTSTVKSSMLRVLHARSARPLWLLTALTAIAPATWGTTYVVTTELLPPDRPLLSGVLRILPAGVAVVLLTRVLPRGRWWWRCGVLGLLNLGAFNALLFAAAYRLPGGVAATLTSMQPLLVAAVAAIALRERPTVWRLGWGVAGVAGVGLMVLRGDTELDLLGVLAGGAAALAMATGIVLLKRWGRPEGVGLVGFTGWQLAAGGLALVPLALVVEGPPPSFDAAAIAGYLWLAVIGTLVAYVFWFQGVERLPVAAVSFLVSALPRRRHRARLAGAGAAADPPATARVPRGAALHLRRSAESASASRRDRLLKGRHMLRTLLVTGATGTVSSALRAALHGGNVEVRAMVRDPAAATRLQGQGVSAVLGDLDDPRSLAPAFEGVHDLWLLVPTGRAPPRTA